MAPLDYKSVALYKDGRVVDSFRVTGLVAELALKSSKKVGITALKPQHLPHHVSWELDGRGEQEVIVHEENRTLAVEVAKAVRVKLHQEGFEVQGVLEGKHDLVVEMVVGADGRLPAQPCGLISVELKLRRIWSEAGRNKVREALRTECEVECQWWQNIVSQSGCKFCGRMVLLVEFGSRGAEFTTRADLKVLGSGFRGVWGWRGSASASRASAPPALAPVPAQSPTSAVQLLGRWARVKEKLGFRREKKRLVASVQSLYSTMHKDTNHIGEKVAAGKRRHDWQDAEIFKAPRRSGKRGGSEEWVAVEKVLRQLHDEA
jgi:hypothetical protein